MRLLKDSLNFEQIVSRVLTFDYIGALLASIIFPLLFIPYLGLAKTSIFFGILNVLTGIFTAVLFKEKLLHYKRQLFSGIICLVFLVSLFAYAETLTSLLESQSFPGKIIHAQSTSYQRIIVTRNEKDIRLFLNGNLQFSSDDEHRYHEALVHPAMQGSKQVKNVLILGGGDGIAMREVLKYPELEHVTLIDLDPSMTKLFKTHPALIEINKHSMLNKKATVINDDAFAWLRKNQNQYDCIIVDFPDPSTYAIAKLYTNTFYTELAKHIDNDGWCVVQCTSPYAAKNSFWTIDTTIRSAGFNTIPYYNMVPSFGMWGYILCSKQNAYTIHRPLPTALKYYTENEFAVMRQFSGDMQPTKKLEVNKLNNQVLVSVFEEEWNKYLQ
jgi:spermidine synthase